MRLSTDIDIIVAPGTDLNTFIEEAGKIFPFVSVEEQVRKGKNNIEKRHFKFVYESPVMERMYGSIHTHKTTFIIFLLFSCGVHLWPNTKLGICS